MRSQDRLDEAKAQRFYWSHSIARVFFSWQKFAHEHAQLFLATQCVLNLFSARCRRSLNCGVQCFDFPQTLCPCTDFLDCRSCNLSSSRGAPPRSMQAISVCCFVEQTFIDVGDSCGQLWCVSPLLPLVTFRACADTIETTCTSFDRAQVLWAERTSAARRQAAANTFARHVALRRGLDALKLSHSKHSHVKHAESATHQAQSRRRLRTCFRQWQGALELEQRSKPIKVRPQNQLLVRKMLQKCISIVCQAPPCIMSIRFFFSLC